MNLRFSKMQSLGNDFVMLNGIDNNITITPAFARLVADRHFGIGCDQILVAENADDPEYVIRMRIFNSDGSEVGQCGNGARCFAMFLRDQGITDQNRIKVETSTTRLELMINADGSVRVDMGVPAFSPALIPMVVDVEELSYRIDTDLGELQFGALSLGNPHCVLRVNDIDTADVSRLGPLLENHPVFPERANIGFAQVISHEHIRLRVYERGAGETLGCGSGACAAVVSLIRSGELDNGARVSLPGGDTDVEWSGGNSPVFLSGPVDTVFKGSFDFGIQNSQ